MTTQEENKANARRFVEEVFNKKNLDVAEELMADGFIEHNAPPGFQPDKKGVLDMFRAMFEAFPDMDTKILDVVAEGDRVVIRSVFSGTQKGEFMGMPATGKKAVDIEGIDIIRNDADGRAIEHWGLVDQTAMMTQLGLMQPPA